MNANKIKTGLALAAALIATSIGLVVARKAGLIDGDLSLRALMVLNGLMLAFYANAIPKAVRVTERARSARRLSGWAFALAAIGYVTVWAFAPIEAANIASMSLLIGAFLVVLGACFWSRAQAPAPQ